MKQTLLKKALVIISVISIVAQSLSPYMAFSQKVYAQEATPTPTIEQPAPTPDATTPTVTETPPVDSTITPTPTDTITPTPTDTPTPEVTAEPTPIVTPTDAVTPTETPVDNLSPPADNSSNQSQVQGASTSVTPTPTLTSPTASEGQTLTPAETSTGNEEISMMILKDVSAPTINLDMIVSEGSASLTTDKPDYAPTDTALITGSNLLPNTTYSLTISSSDEPPTSTTVNVTSDDKGVFAYAYQLDGNYRPNYKAELRDASGTLVATTTFTDAYSTNTSIALTVGSNPSVSGDSLTFTSTTVRTTGGSAVTVGTVTFRDTANNCNQGTVLQTATTPDSNGRVTFTTTSLSVGGHTIQACYNGTGGGGSQDSRATIAQTVNNVTPPIQDQTITFGALSNKTFGDADFTVSAIASSGLAVTFSTASTACM
jgi:hypothetical protein